MTGDILASFFKKVFTEKYPYETKTVTERARGEVEWDGTKCNGCRLCVKDCPANAIEIRVIDRPAKKHSFEYHRDRCIYCGQCVISCKPGALSMPAESWHLASMSRKDFAVLKEGQQNAGQAESDGTSTEK
jgi:formate hydrogenlyase subunit 6/NADH:ubiquinone oxidoreductase subunit I